MTSKCKTCGHSENMHTFWNQEEGFPEVLNCNDCTCEKFIPSEDVCSCGFDIKKGWESYKTCNYCKEKKGCGKCGGAKVLKNQFGEYFPCPECSNQSPSKLGEASTLGNNNPGSNPGPGTQSPHNTIAESDRTDLLDSGSEVGEQVGPVGSHNSLKALRNKSRRVAGSGDEDTFNLSDEILDNQYLNVNKVKIFIAQESKLIEQLERQLINDFKTPLSVKSAERFIRTRIIGLNSDRAKLAGEEVRSGE